MAIFQGLGRTRPVSKYYKSRAQVRKDDAEHDALLKREKNNFFSKLNDRYSDQK